MAKATVKSKPRLDLSVDELWAVYDVVASEVLSRPTPSSPVRPEREGPLSFPVFTLPSFLDHAHEKLRKALEG